MAAGQARLLSITSRMSDNELRAQLINNSKMRLATESSKASEAYVAALNETQMMFTNYGADNTTSYQELTYNALTAYNPYNNQYALTNASGQILVSETDANNYINSGGSLTRFLASYGLNKGTTYFDELSKYLDEKGEVANIGYTPEELKAMYYGTNGYPGYQALLTSDAYFSYQELTESLTSQYDSLLDGAWGSNDSEGIRGELLGGTNDKYKVNSNGTKFSFIDFKNDVKNNNNADAGYNSNYYPGKISDFMNYLDAVSETLAGGKNNALYKETKKILGDALNKYHLTTPPDKDGNYTASGGKYNTSSYPSSGVSNVDDSVECVKVSADQVKMNFDGVWLIVTKDSSGSYTFAQQDDDGVDASGTSGLSTSLSGSQLTVVQNWLNEDEDGNSTITGNKSYETVIDLNKVFTDSSSVDLNGSFNVDSKYTFYQPSIEEDLEQSFNYAVSLWESSLKNNINPTMFPSIANNNEAMKNFMNTGKELAKFLFGETALAPSGPIKESDYPSLMTIDGIYQLMKDNPGLTATAGFNQVLDLMTLENMMDIYGEPKITWIDNTDPQGSGDAEKKAQWYTNLFERMGNGEKNNFKILGNGLASSPEWIKFALESGIVTMEQVTEANEWSSVIYSNVSDITEQTSDLAVTKAEAEYKKAMNKIETKDKQYDMELKNIDTEHNSLQTEYDSIKSAIDKNVERTFKLYS